MSTRNKQVMMDALIVDIPEQLKENDDESYTETSLF